MQTFLPYPDFNKCAECLDRQRLGKQRVEALTVLRILAKNIDGPAMHPVVLMWCGSEQWLNSYCQAMCTEWVHRGYEDNCAREALVVLNECCKMRDTMTRPPWLGDERLHANHRGRLMAKLPAHYIPQWPFQLGENYNLWPVTIAGPWMYCIEGKMVPYDDVHLGQSHRGLVQAAP